MKQERKLRPSPARNSAESKAGDSESRVVDEYWRQQKPVPQFKNDADGDAVLDYVDEKVGGVLLANALGSLPFAVVNGLVRQLTALCLSPDLRHVDARKLNFMIGVISSIGPRDALEALLAAQMAAIHWSTLDATFRAGQATHRQTREAELRAGNTSSRTFATQLLALKQHRSKGEQSVRVVHVHQHVGDGGKAIGVVGGSPGGNAGGREAIDGQSHASSPLAGSSAGAALLCALEEERGSVPGAGDEG